MDNLELLFQNQVKDSGPVHGAGGFFYRNPIEAFQRGFAQVNQEEELKKVKQFIMEQAQVKAQREQERHVLDQVIKQKEAAEAADIINSPEYRDSKLKGYIGQMQSQEAAGNKAKLLAPFETASKQMEYENNFRSQRALQSVQEIDAALRSGTYRNPNTGEEIPLTPELQNNMQKTREQITQQLMSTPEFASKIAIQDNQGTWNEKLEKIRQEGYKNRFQDVKARKDAWSKLPPATRMGEIQRGLAMNKNPITGEDLTDAERAGFMAEYNQDRLIVNSNVNKGNTGSVYKDGKAVPAPQMDVGTPTATTNTATTNGVTYKYNNKGERIQ